MYTLTPCSLSTRSQWFVSDGPPRCWTTLEREMRPVLRRSARRLLDHEHDAEDAVQEAFLRAWSGVDHLRDPDALEGWMRVVLRHVALDMVRRRCVRHALSLDAEDVPDRRREARPETPASISDAVSLLPIGQAQVLRAAAEGHALGDVAASLGIRTPAVKTRLSRARAALRREL